VTSPKTILITEPEDSILRRLAVRFLEMPPVRLVCFRDEPEASDDPLQEITLHDGELRFADCAAASVDEIWHAGKPAHSPEKSRNATVRVLAFADKSGVKIIHYVSSLCVTGLSANACADGSEEERHLWTEKALEQSGCRIRIYHVPLLADGKPEEFHIWGRFVRMVRRFKQEIEDRIPLYFAANPLRIHLAEEGRLSLARVNDVAEALMEISSASSSSEAATAHFYVHSRPPMRLGDYSASLAQVTGVRVQAVGSGEPINSVDRLFALKIKELLAYLNCTTMPSEENVRNRSNFPEGNATWCEIPQAADADIVSAAGSSGDFPEPAVSDWRSRFEKKQLPIPGGVTLNYYAGGRGDSTLVLLNAYGQSFGYWEKFIERISTKVRVILWVPRGNDCETPGLALASPQSVHADDLDRVLAWEGVKSCTLLAWCSGPKLALEYYARYPHRVSSMVSVAASFKGLPQHKALETAYEKNLESLLETIEKYPETADMVLEYLKGILLGQNKRARTLEELASISEKDLQEALSSVNVSLQELVLQPFCAASAVVAYARQMRDFWKHDYLPVLSRVQVPVLFLGGDCDRIASQAIAKVVSAAIPQAKYMEIKGGTHYIHYEQWDLLAQVMEDVVNSGGNCTLTQPWVSMAVPCEELTSMRQIQA
jgi:pimeloyl-ACP methyl ester carboxylesterase